MKIPRYADKRAGLNITPLIDVVFILLVFFMLAGAVRPSDPFPVTPAETRSPQEGDAEPFIVLIDADGRIALNGEPLRRDALAEAVRAALARAPRTVIQVKPDAEAEADALIAAMEEIRDAGAQTLVLLTVGQAESGTPPQDVDR